MQKESSQSKYNKLLEKTRAAGESAAYVYIPTLCDVLKQENISMSNHDFRHKVTKDLKDIWSKTIIKDAIPEEYKDPS